MIDFIASVFFFGFFGFLVYATVIRGRNKEQPVNRPEEVVAEPVVFGPSPVGIFCSICRTEADVVSASEYSRISRTGIPIYCQSCTRTIETYKAQQMHRAG